MSYVVSARKWRPQTFEDLIGQEHVSRTLANAIRANRVAHAFLFTGVRGVGKTTAARILAKALNCEKGPTPTPCNACTNCREITAGSAVDVLEIDGASNTGVDDVREIIENVRYQAAKSRYKIYIIDEVHMLSNSAFNALLKTLEEPPAHVKFIFATTDPHKLPATVQSRCQRYDFRRIPLGLVVQRLRRIAEEEKVALSDKALYVLAREGEGSMRDAQSLLDQVLAGGESAIGDDQVLAALGIADRQVLYDIADAVIDRRPARALELLDSVYRSGYDMRRLARDLVEHFRDLAVTRVTRGELVPELPDEEARALRAQAERIAAEDCDRAFRMLQGVDEEIGRSPCPKLVLEMALIRVADLPPLLPVAELLERIEHLEARLRGTSGSGGTAPPRSPADPAPRSRPAAGPPLPDRATPPAPVAPSGPGPASTAAMGWGGFVEFVTRERGTLGHHLARCELEKLDGVAMTIGVPKGFAYNYLSRREHLEEIEALAGRYFEREIRVTIKAMEAAREEMPEAKAERVPRGKLAEEVMGNPVVRAAVEILGGEVSEVRSRTGRRREDA